MSLFNTYQKKKTMPKIFNGVSVCLVSSIYIDTNGALHYIYIYIYIYIYMCVCIYSNRKNGNNIEENIQEIKKES